MSNFIKCGLLGLLITGIAWILMYGMLKLCIYIGPAAYIGIVAFVLFIWFGAILGDSFEYNDEGD